MLLCSYVGCIYIYSCYIFFLDWSLDRYIVSLSAVTAFILKFILCDMSIATLAVFCFLFAWNTFFYSLTFILYEFHINSIYMGLDFISIQPVCLFWLEHLIYIFKVISNMLVPVVIFLIVLDLFL